MKNIILSMFLLLTSLPSMAERAVGNGGGLLENQIVYVWEDLELLADRCYKSVACGTGEDKNFLKAVVTKIQDKKIDIAFYEEQQRTDLRGKLFVWSSNILTFNSTQLYRLYPDVIRFTLKESLTIILSAFADANTDSAELANQLAELVFAKEKNGSFAVFGLPAIQFKLTGQAYENLLLNDEEGLRSLNPFVLQYLTCPGKVDKLRYRYLLTQSYDAKQGLAYASAEIQYTCQRLWHSATLFVTLQVVDSVKVDLKRSRVQVMSVKVNP